MSETGKLPPGPFPLPLIGNMLQHKASGCNLKAVFFFGRLFHPSKKYGSLFTICSDLVCPVVLYGPYAVK